MFTFTRNTSAMVLDIGVYVLSFILVLISWYAFWLPPVEFLIPRMGLGLGVVLSLGVYSLAIVEWYSRGGAGYAHALTVWLGGCWICVLIPLLELGMVYFIFTLIPNRLAAIKGIQPVSYTNY